VQVPAPLVVPELKFVKNKKNWGMYLQGAAVKLNEADHNAIIAIACMLNPTLKKSFAAHKGKRHFRNSLQSQKSAH
jgi:hypothetical protein